MEEAIGNLNNHLQTFLSLPTDDTQTPIIGRNLTQISEDPLFMDTALALLSQHALPTQKIILLTIMIKDKFKYDFEMLDSQKLNIYYWQLCQIAVKLGNLQKAITSNISQSLALIYINQLTKKDCLIEEFIHPLIPPPEQQSLPLYNYYFKVLGYCASQIDNNRVVMEEQLRNQAKNRMRAQQSTVLQILSSSVDYVWNQPKISSKINKKVVIQCFGNWLDLNFDLSLICGKQNSTLIRVVIQVLKDNQTSDFELLEIASDCIQSIIDCISKDRQRFEMFYFLGNQINLISRHIDFRLSQHQTELAHPLLEVTIFFAKKFHKLLIDNYSQSTRILLIQLIKYFNTNLEGIIDALLQFWQIFLKYVSEVKLEDTLSPEFKYDIFLQLTRSLIDLCRYPNYLISELQISQEHKLWINHQEAQEIYRTRLSIGSCFDLIAKLIGVNWFVKQVVKLIAEQHHSNPSFWSILDACMYSLIQPLKKLQTITDDATLLVNTYQQLTEDNRPCPILIRRTFLRVFKSLFYLKIKDADLIKKLLFFISQCFETEIILETAQCTFYRGCQENTTLIYNCLTSITDMVQLLKHYPTKEYIVRGVIRLVCVDPTNAERYLQTCLNSIILSAFQPHTSAIHKKECLQALSASFKEIRNQTFPERNQIIKSFLRKSWNYIIAFLQNPQNRSDDQDIQVERTVKLLKSIMRILELEFAEFLESLFESVNKSFQMYPICSYIYLVEVTITVFAKQPELTHFIKAIYEQFSIHAFNHLRTPQSLENYGYLVDDFLGMNSRLILYNTSVIVSSRIFPDLLQFVSNSCIQANSLRVLKATYSFFQTLFMLFWSPEFIEEYNGDVEDNSRFQPFIQHQDLYLQLKNYIVEQRIRTILKLMIQHLTEVPAQMIRDQILDALVSQTKAFPLENLRIWGDLLVQISGNVFLSGEKVKMMQILQLMQIKFRQNESCKDEIKNIMKMFNLMNKRMMANEKRKQFKLDL